MADKAHPIDIGVLSLGRDESIEQHFISTIRTCKTEVKFISLAPTDLNEYTAPRNLDAVILLHSIIEGRLSLTDVKDARYEKLLPTLFKQYGRHSICVVAYLVKDLNENTYQTRLQMMKTNQPTVFKMSSCVILCGRLEAIFHHDLVQIKTFIKNQWERIREQTWQEDWFPPSKKNQPNDITRAIDIPAAKDINKDSRREPHGQGDREPSLLIDKTSKSDRNTDVNIPMRDISQRVDSTKDNNKDSIKELCQSYKEIRASVRQKNKGAEGTPNVVFGSMDLPAKPNDACDIQGAVLVTNASGFVASHIVTKLLENGYNVRVTLSTIGHSISLLEKGERNLNLFEEDITEADRLKEIVQGCTHVIHTADVLPDSQMTTSGITGLLKACADDGGVKRVIVTGSCDFAEGDMFKENYFPTDWEKLNSILKDAYWKALTEREALQFAAGQKINLSIIRSSVVMGPISSTVKKANKEMKRRFKAEIEMVRRLQDDIMARNIYFPMCDVRDVAEAYIVALKDETTVGKCVSVTHQVLSFKRMRDIIKETFDPRGKVLEIKLISSIGQIENETTKALHQLYDDKRSYSHHRKKFRVLVNSPISMKITVIDMVQSYIDHEFITKLKSRLS